MTAQSSPRITYLINSFADWLKHRRELNEIRRLDRGEFDRIAADLEISSSELEELVRRGVHAADELPLLLKALEIDEAALERMHPLVLRDMERVCTLCRHKARCDSDLTDGTSAEYFSSYCPNESTINQLERTAAARPTSQARLLVRQRITHQRQPCAPNLTQSEPPASRQRHYSRGEDRAMTSFTKELDRLVCQHTVKARWAEDFIPVLNALYDAANQLASEADRHPWKDTDKRLPVLTDDTFG